LIRSELVRVEPTASMPGSDDQSTAVDANGLFSD
jgi:hypothetical protein